VVTPAPDFTLSATPPSKSIRHGQTASYVISTAPIAGFGGTVSLSLQGSPPGVTPSFAPNPIAVPGTSTLTVKTKSSTPRGTYTLVVTGTSGSVVHTATLTLVVT
jgi:hypothetical protein